MAPVGQYQLWPDPVAEIGLTGDRHLLGWRIAVVLAELHEPEVVRSVLIQRNDGQRPQELVPAVAEGEDRQDRERRQTLRYDDLQKNAQLAGPVNTRGLDVVGW